MKWRYAIPCAVLLNISTAQAEPAIYVDQMIEREGISMRLRVEAIDTDAPLVPHAGQFVRLRLDGKRLGDTEPLRNWSLGAWLDRQTDTMSGAVPVCGQRVARYLSGNLMQRPLLDLTGYYVLSLDAEPSVSVLDPSVSFGGRSSLYGVIKLEGRGFDWLKTADNALLFVALPQEKKLAIIDLQTLKIIDHLPLPGRPTRLALQPDERLLWVGQAGSDSKESESAVRVVDTLSQKMLQHISLPAGHHEFAFSEDSRFAYITTRQAGTLTIVDINSLKVAREITLGFEPLGLVFPFQGRIGHLLWVVNAHAGRIHRYNPGGDPVDTVALEPGLGPAKVTPDGRYVLIVNPSQHSLHVLETSTGKVKHRLTVSGQPYDIIFSERYAYIRTLESEHVGLLSLSSLDSAQAFLKFVPAGAVPVTKAADLPRASSMSVSLDNASAFFVTPAERTIYHYMEGMNSPGSGVRTYGHVPMAAMVVQRGLREAGPGQYTAVIRLPSAGRMVLAIASESPVLRECIGLKVEAPKQNTDETTIAMQWLSDSAQSVSAGAPLSFRLGIKNVEDLAKVQSSTLRLRIVPAYGGVSVVWPLKADPTRPGEWVAKGKLYKDGGYYVYVEGSPAVQSIYSTVLVAGNAKIDPEEN
jgi:DNA-binding beta-propeller fold protein YncE